MLTVSIEDLNSKARAFVVYCSGDGKNIPIRRVGCNLALSVAKQHCESMHSGSIGTLGCSDFTDDDAGDPKPYPLRATRAQLMGFAMASYSLSQLMKTNVPRATFTGLK